jgi:hypothetical protein
LIFADGQIGVTETYRSIEASAIRLGILRNLGSVDHKVARNLLKP